MKEIGEKENGKLGQFWREFNEVDEGLPDDEKFTALDAEVFWRIPIGKENAIRRKKLSKGLNISDREVRRTVEKLRKYFAIINLQDGNGYFKPDCIEDTERWVRQEQKRARRIQEATRGAKKWLLKNMEI